MKPSYFTVEQECENVIVISKSKFITTLTPIKDYDDAIAKIKSISKKYSDATHNCYAFVSSENAIEQRFSDDGEPQGTAGIPMLDVLKKRNVYMTLAVVTRYFGGIKLGANGLVGAYSSSVSEALDCAKVVKMVWADVLKVTASYSIYKKVEEACISKGGKTIQVDYDNEVNLTIALPQDMSKDFVSKVVDITLDKARIEIISTQYVAMSQAE